MRLPGLIDWLSPIHPIVVPKLLGSMPAPSDRRAVAEIRDVECLDDRAAEAAVAAYERLGWLDTMRTLGLPGQSVAVEITEGLLLDADAEITDKLLAFRDAGVTVSLDDFGTGYSSLLHLKRFPIKTLKIDQSFIQDITTDPDDAAIAQAIIALAESLRLRVIAEGVETRAQLDLLRRYQCDQMQGYLFSKPLPADEMLMLLQSGRRLAH